MAAGWADPDVGRWTQVPDDRSVEAARRWIAGEPERWSCGLAFDLVIADGDDRPVGEVGIRPVDGRPPRGEIGWWLAPAARGRGLATRAVRAAVRWALTSVELVQVFARIDPPNERSRRVVERAGFTLLGRAEGKELWVAPPAVLVSDPDREAGPVRPGRTGESKT